MEKGVIGHGKSGGSEGSRSIGNPKNESEKDADSHLKSGGSLRSQSGTLEGGSVGHGKSGWESRGIQGEESLSLSEKPGNVGGAVVPQMGGDDGSSSLDKSGDAVFSSILYAICFSWHFIGFGHRSRVLMYSD